MSITQKIKKIFIAGILSLLPMVVTIYIVYLLYNFIISKASPVVKKVAHQYGYNFSEYVFQLSSLGIIILLIFIIGIFTRMYIGKLFMKMLDKIIAYIPIARSIYNATKQLIDSFGSTSGSSFSKVLLVEFPRKDMWMLGFLVRKTSPIMEEVSTGEESSNVFIPTAPNPTTGYIAVVPNKDIRELDISVEEGIKFVLSLGVLNLNKDEEIKKLIREK